MARLTLFRTLTVFGVACVLAFSFGCSSSDKATNNNSATNLDQLEEFVEDDFYTMALQSLDLSLSLLDSIPSSSVPENRTKTVLEDLAAADGDDIVIGAIGSYAYENGWHIFEFAAEVDPSDGSGLADVTGFDSVKVLQGGTPMGPGADFSQLDEVISHAHYNWSAHDGSMSAEAYQVVGISVDVAGSDTTFVIDGSFGEAMNATLEDSTTSCSFDFDLDAVANDLSIGSADDCPQSGSVQMILTIDASCLSTEQGNPQSISIEGSVTVTAVANGNDSVTITMTDGVNTKQVTDQCSGPATSPWSVPQN